MSRPASFDAPERQSIVKTDIVSQYFKAWSKIMLSQTATRIAYIDLFSGPGVFADGTASTPISILNSAIQDEALRTRLITIFNDKDAGYANQLQSAIDALAGIETLTHQPQVSNVEIGSAAVDLFRRIDLIPTLFFIDPWGYKGLSLDLIGAAIKSWGCECIFFFNFNRINAGISNQSVEPLMAELFGPERFERIRKEVDGLSPRERETAIISAITEALKEIGGRYVLPFGIRSQHGERTSHYIIFVSKHVRGYLIMKDVMAKLSSDDGEVKNFEYVPVKSPQLRLLDIDNPHSIAALKTLLLELGAGKSLKVVDVYERYTVDTPYLLQHIQRALKELEAEGKVTIDIPADKRPKKKGEVTLGEKRIVTFPA